MDAANKLDRMRAQLEKLRKDSLDTVVAANKIVYQGVQRVADHELKTLNDTYRAALGSLKQVKRSDGLKGVAGKQVDVLQDAANRIIASARESLEIVAETRQELTKMIQKNLKDGKISSAEIERTAKQARKAVTKVRDSARKAAKNAQKKSIGTAKPAHKAAKKAVTKSAPTKPRSTVRRSKAVAAESVSTLVPSPNSRASRATSRAKKAANKMGGAATHAVDTTPQQPAGS